ncbi:MAG: DAPG hydrolase family protein [Rufibacter sp.]
MKPLSSAKTTFSVLPQGSYEMTIAHDIIKEVSPQMLEWWFRNIGGTMEINNTIYPKYRVWHPVDHIHWELVNYSIDGTVGVGSRFRIVEAFGADRKKMVDSVEDVEKLDITGIRLTRSVLGKQIFSLEHWFEPHALGAQYFSRMQVGAESAFGKFFFQPLIRPFIFTREMAQAWLLHNIEEVGNFEFFLPRLYSRSTEKGEEVCAVYC